MRQHHNHDDRPTDDATHRRVWRWIFVVMVLAIAIVTVRLVIPNQDLRWVVTSGTGIDLGPRPGPTNTADVGDEDAPGEGVLGTVIAEMMRAADADALTDLIGRPVAFDVRWHRNDVAFWMGAPPYDLLVVPSRDTRSGLEQQIGQPSDSPVQARSAVVRMHGTIRSVPYAEATYSWCLTRRDIQRLVERRVYLHVHEAEPLQQPRLRAGPGVAATSPKAVRFQSTTRIASRTRAQSAARAPG